MTRRKRIINALRYNPLTIEEISEIAEVNVKTVISDLKHIRLSLKNQNKSLYIQPPYCNSCDSIINIKDIKNIKKCPKCKSEWISRARFFIR